MKHSVFVFVALFTLLFAGCGGLSLGFEAQGFRTMGYEMDSNCCKTYNRNLQGECIEMELGPDSDIAKAEIIVGGPPCQPFSEAGAGAGFADERHLWPHWHWLIQHCRPRVVVGEQVAAKDGLGWFDLVSADLAGIGYARGAVDLAAAGFGMDWRGSAEQQRVERALRLCPDPLVGE